MMARDGLINGQGLLARAIGSSSSWVWWWLRLKRRWETTCHTYAACLSFPRFGAYGQPTSARCLIEELCGGLLVTSRCMDAAYCDKGHMWFHSRHRIRSTVKQDVVLLRIQSETLQYHAT